MKEKQKKILLIEDNPGDARLIQEMLSEMNHEQFKLECVGSLSDALNHLKNKAVDLVLVDLNLPDCKGLDSFKKIQSVVSHLPIVVLTGLDDEEVATRAVKLGAQDYLVKGQFDANSLRRAVNYAIERKKIKRSLEENEARLNILFEYAPDAYYLNDLEGNFVDGNRAAEKLIGYKREELIGKNFLKLKLLPSNQMPKAAKLLAKHALGYSTGPDEFTLIRKDGIKITAEIRSHPVKIDNQTLVLALARDITDRKQAEEKIKSQKKFTDDLIDSLPDTFYIFDPESGKGIRWNNTLNEISGYNYEEMSEYSPLHFYPPEEHQLIEEAVKTTLEKGHDTVELNYICADGKRIPFEYSTVLIKDTEGNPRICAIGRDITERKHTEEQIRASLREKEVMLQEIHHRVKNNMQIISSLIKLQSRHLKNGQELELFKNTQNRIQSMAAIHEKLYQSKDFARIDFKEYVQRLTGHLFSIYGISKEAVRLNTNIKDVSLDINTAIPCGLIINELVSNSLKHAFLNGNKGEIKIAMQPLNGKEIELIVSDSGVGLPKEMNFRKTKSLGLHLVTILAEDQLQGDIELDRTAGTRFRMRLRLSEK